MRWSFWFEQPSQVCVPFKFVCASYKTEGHCCWPWALSLLKMSVLYWSPYLTGKSNSAEYTNVSCLPGNRNPCTRRARHNAFRACCASIPMRVRDLSRKSCGSFVVIVRRHSSLQALLFFFYRMECKGLLTFQCTKNIQESNQGVDD